MTFISIKILWNNTFYLRGSRSITTTPRFFDFGIYLPLQDRFCYGYVGNFERIKSFKASTGLLEKFIQLKLLISSRVVFNLAIQHKLIAFSARWMPNCKSYSFCIPDDSEVMLSKKVLFNKHAVDESLNCLQYSLQDFLNYKTGCLFVLIHFQYCMFYVQGLFVY